jgi:c-di-GMP-binding flagellar brake protein YcgR
MSQAAERRKDIRIDTQFQAEYWAKGPSMQSGKGEIRNFSRRGLQMFFADPVKAGEHIDITMKVPGDNVPIFATAEVAWTKDEEKKKTGAGLKFLSIRPLGQVAGE